MTEAASTALAHADNSQMLSDFQALCDLGGRLAGTASEAAALDFGRQRLAAVPGAQAQQSAGSHSPL